LCLCVGFAFQLLGFIYPDYGPDASSTSTTLHQVDSSVTCARLSSPPVFPSPGG